ncbi:MAG: universal stress protein [Myxococcota bacterium]|nr:universal stress protein [Myxococcota bacterium]
MVARSILVATDFSQPSRRALEWARLLRARLDAAILVAHVDADPFAHTTLRDDAAKWQTDSERGRRMEWLKSELNEQVDDLFGPDAQAVRQVVVHGETVEALIELALERDADLLVVGASGKNAVDRLLLGSTTQELVQRSPIPVLTVH